MYKENLDNSTINIASYMISKYSRWENYPISPKEELEKCEYSIGAFDENKLVGLWAVSRYASPDEKDQWELRLWYLVIDPKYRNLWIWKEIYKKQFVYCLKNTWRILSCTDNPIMKNIFKKDWRILLRETIDESWDSTTVYEFIRQ